MRERIIGFFGGAWGLLLGAALLRFPFLGIESLWYDEVLTVRDALAPVSEIILNRWDPHPPLYYLLLHGWMKLGGGDGFVRIPAALFGVLSIPVAYWLTKRLFSKEVAYLSALLLAITPLHIWYSQETRMYSMLILWGLLSTLFLVMLLQGERKLWVGAGYVLATTLGLYSQYTIILLIIAQNLYVTAVYLATKPRQSILGQWMLLQLLVVILYLPWLPNIPSHWQIIRTSTNYPMWIFATNPFLVGFGLLTVAVWISLWQWKKPAGGTLSVNLSAGIRKTFFILALSFSLLVYFGYLAIAMTNRLTTFKRQSFIAFPFLCIAVIVLLAYLPHWQRWARLLLVISFVAGLVNNFSLQKPPWREAVAWVEGHANASDVIVINPGWAKPVLDYYIQASIPVERAAPGATGTQGVQLRTDYANIWLITNRKFELYDDPQRNYVNWYLDRQAPAQVRQMGELELLVFKPLSEIGD